MTRYALVVLIVALVLLPLAGASVTAEAASSPAASPTPTPTFAATPTPAALPTAALAPTPRPTVDPLAQPELRGVWVDAYHDGIKTPEQVDALLAWVRQANLNAVFVQVRRRGDAYYNKTFEPRTEDASLAPGFDALQYLIDKAHQGPQRIQVHAWLATLPAWGSPSTPPVDPSHVFNQHGLAAGPDTWLMLRDDGEAWTGAIYYLDPGNPAAAQYVTDTYLNVVRNYDVDGIHLDQVRYFEGDGGRWGYNPTSVARFDQAMGRDPASVPDPQDPDWDAWRREQVTALVRRIDLEAKAIKPNIVVSAAVVAWGRGPAADGDWSATAPYATVFQEWPNWLKQGIVDYVVPMDYYREQTDQAGWFDNWTAWQVANKGARGVVPGIGGYLNASGDDDAQITRARLLGPLGVALYSYAEPDLEAAGGDPSAQQAAAAWLRGLFPRPAPPPDLTWGAGATTGSLLVEAPGTDGATVNLSGPSSATWTTDGTGVTGGADVRAGRYQVVLTTDSGRQTSTVDVAAGQTAHLVFAAASTP